MAGRVAGPHERRSRSRRPERIDHRSLPTSRGRALPRRRREGREAAPGAPDSPGAGGLGGSPLRATAPPHRARQAPPGGVQERRGRLPRRTARGGGAATPALPLGRGPGAVPTAPPRVCSLFQLPQVCSFRLPLTVHPETGRKDTSRAGTPARSRAGAAWHTLPPAPPNADRWQLLEGAIEAWPRPAGATLVPAWRRPGGAEIHLLLIGTSGIL